MLSCVITGTSLNEPHTSVTALQHACVCLSVCLRVAIYRKFKLNKHAETKVHVHFKFAHIAKAF